MQTLLNCAVFQSPGTTSVAREIWKSPLIPLIAARDTSYQALRFYPPLRALRHLIPPLTFLHSENAGSKLWKERRYPFKILKGKKFCNYITVNIACHNLRSRSLFCTWIPANQTSHSKTMMSAHWCKTKMNTNLANGISKTSIASQTWLQKYTYLTLFSFMPPGINSKL